MATSAIAKLITAATETTPESVARCAPLTTPGAPAPVDEEELEEGAEGRAETEEAEEAALGEEEEELLEAATLDCVLDTVPVDGAAEAAVEAAEPVEAADTAEAAEPLAAPAPLALPDEDEPGASAVAQLAPAGQVPL